MNDELACTNCEIGFGSDYGAAGNKCPACGNGAITWVED